MQKWHITLQTGFLYTWIYKGKQQTRTEINLLNLSPELIKLVFTTTHITCDSRTQTLHFEWKSLTWLCCKQRNSELESRYFALTTYGLLWSACASSNSSYKFIVKLMLLKNHNSENILVPTIRVSRQVICQGERVAYKGAKENITVTAGVG
jgi:hypothetical protein